MGLGAFYLFASEKQRDIFRWQLLLPVGAETGSERGREASDGEGEGVVDFTSLP